MLNWAEAIALVIVVIGTTDSQTPVETTTLLRLRLLRDVVPVMVGLDLLLSTRSAGTLTTEKEMLLTTDVTGMNVTQDTVATMTLRPSRPTRCAVLALVAQVDHATIPMRVLVMSPVTSVIGTMPTQALAETTIPKISFPVKCAASAEAEATQAVIGPSPCLPNSSVSRQDNPATPPTPPLEVLFSLLSSALT